MLYVDDVEANSQFWQSIGFTEIERQEIDNTLVVEVGMTEDSSAHIVLYDRKFIEEHSPEVGMNSPSLMFSSKNIFSLYKKMQENNNVLGELIQLSETDYVFNFADPDGNYFAVSGQE